LTVTWQNIMENVLQFLYLALTQRIKMISPLIVEGLAMC